MSPPTAPPSWVREVCLGRVGPSGVHGPPYTPSGWAARAISAKGLLGSPTPHVPYVACPGSPVLPVRWAGRMLPWGDAWGVHPTHTRPGWSSDPPYSFPTVEALPEGPGRPVLGVRWVRGCAAAVWAGCTCLRAGCVPKPQQGLWAVLGVPSISPLHGDGARDGGCGL
eukprot:scaffold145191_cov78-Phaeocystis_antarctica.AAC.1